jgi:hypothetical protein
MERAFTRGRRGTPPRRRGDLFVWTEAIGSEVQPQRAAPRPVGVDREVGAVVHLAVKDVVVVDLDAQLVDTAVAAVVGAQRKVRDLDAQQTNRHRARDVNHAVRVGDAVEGKGQAGHKVRSTPSGYVRHHSSSVRRHHCSSINDV